MSLIFVWEYESCICTPVFYELLSKVAFSRGFLLTRILCQGRHIYAEWFAEELKENILKIYTRDSGMTVGSSWQGAYSLCAAFNPWKLFPCSVMIICAKRSPALCCSRCRCLYLRSFFIKTPAVLAPCTGFMLLSARISAWWSAFQCLTFNQSNIFANLLHTVNDRI